MGTGRRQDQPDSEQPAVPDTALGDLEPADADTDGVTGGADKGWNGDGG